MTPDYQLIRSNRKTVALCVRNGLAQVRAPLKMPKEDIDKFVETKQQWIADRQVAYRQIEEKRSAFHLSYNSRFPLAGQSYPIRTMEGGRVGFDGTAFVMPPDMCEEQIRSACEQIYRLAAKQHIPQRTAALCGRMGVTPAAVKINGAKSRWGSCSGKKNLNFSWRLMMADTDMIDYVITHELAHLTEMNHSSCFWAIVESINPQYRQMEERLYELQKQLAIEGWE